LLKKGKIRTGEKISTEPKIGETQKTTEEDDSPSTKYLLKGFQQGFIARRFQ